jgi:NDP-sugar pyrophosphorylase family protein
MIARVSKRAVILAGGLGTRLRPYTVVLPKPLMPVGDRPVLDIVVRQLRARGFEAITIATGYLAELIEAFFRDGGDYDIPIDYFREHEPLGTVGALGLIDGLDEDFLVMNGDILTDLDYAQLLADHVRSDAIATIATRTTKVQISLDFPDLMLRLVAEGEIVRAWRSNDFWLDIGRPEDYEQAQDDIDALRDRLIPD